MRRVERLLQLQDKAAATGLPQREFEELRRLNQVITEQDLREFYDLQKQKQENAHEYESLKHQAYLLDLYRQARNSRGQILKQCEANDQLIRELRMPADVFLDAVKRSDIASRFLWIDQPASKTDPKQLEKDRETLEGAAKANGNFGSNEANLSLIRDTLGPGFTQHALIQAVVSNAIHLAAPSDEERQHWAELAEDERKLRLMNASTSELKQEIRDEYLERRAQAAQADADRVLDQKREWQTGQFKPLPRTWNNQRLDAAFIKGAPPQLIRQLREHYGSLQLDLRLRGEN